MWMWHKKLLRFAVLMHTHAQWAIVLRTSDSSSDANDTIPVGRLLLDVNNQKIGHQNVE